MPVRDAKYVFFSFFLCLDAPLPPSVSVFFGATVEGTRTHVREAVSAEAATTASKAALFWHGFP